MEESEDEPNVQTVYIAAYKNFMEAIDAIDNGELSSPTVQRRLETIRKNIINVIVLAVVTASKQKHFLQAEAAIL